MFGVIVCGRCHRPRGVDLATSRARCPHCGASIDVTRARVFFSTDSQSELAEAVRAYSEARWDIEHTRAPPPREVDDDPYGTVASRAERIRDEEERLRYVARELCLLHDPFSKEQLGRVVDDAPGALAKLLALGLVYEPSPGLYRAL